MLYLLKRIVLIVLHQLFRIYNLLQLFVREEVKVPSNPFEDKICRLKKQLQQGCQKGRNFIPGCVKAFVSRVGKINASISKWVMSQVLKSQLLRSFNLFLES